VQKGMAAGPLHRSRSGATPPQTARALLGLMAAGEIRTAAVRRGIAFLENRPRRGANRQDEFWTRTGFPRVFY
jgi:squalene-hopene/tetraprenyl-beta-curcumene cyclase